MEKDNTYKPDNLSVRLPKMIGVSICILFTLTCLSGVAYLYLQQREASEDIAFKQKRIKSLEEDAKKLKVLLTRYRKDIKSFEGLLFKDKDIPLFLEGISKSSKKFKIRIVEIRALALRRVLTEEERAYQTKRNKKQEEQSMEDKLYLASSPFTIKLKGDFKNIVNFLFSVEKHRQLLSLTDVKVKVDTYPTLECSFRLNLYSLKTLEAIEKKK